jgi:hypothetical protein
MSCSLFYVLANPDASLAVLDTLPNAATRQSILTLQSTQSYASVVGYISHVGQKSDLGAKPKGAEFWPSASFPCVAKIRNSVKIVGPHKNVNLDATYVGLPRHQTARSLSLKALTPLDVGLPRHQTAGSLPLSSLL